MERHHFIYIAGLALMGSLLLGSCETRETELKVNPRQTVLKASLEGDTKTALSPDNGSYKVLWSEDDQIGVYIDGAATPNLFKLSSGAGTKQAQFSGFGKGSAYVAVYPYSSAGDYDGRKVTLTIPSEQYGGLDSFGNGSFPMIAEAASSDLQFKNLCSVLKLSITGHHTVTAIEFTSADPSCKVSGPATVETGSGSVPSLVMSEEGSETLTLDTGGVMLKDDQATDFYISLPPQVYKGGFTVKVITSTGYMLKTYDKDFEMVRSKVHESTPFSIKLDEGVEPSTFLEGSGTEADPFLIKSLGDLLLMQASVNATEGTIKTQSGEEVNASSAFYTLMADIDLSPICSEASGRSWDPIGDYATNENFNFIGTFDGNGHTISNLYIDSELGHRALFGKAMSGWPYTGTIMNLDVQGSVTGRGSGVIAMIAAEAYSVNFCTANGTVNYEGGSSYTAGIVADGYYIERCINFAEVNGAGMVGGITGSTSARAFDCDNHGTINGRGSYVGGIVGYLNAGYLFNCSNDASISSQGSNVGGIAGYNRQGSKLDNCINTGDVSSKNGKVGGISGECNTWSDPPDTAIRNCVNTGNVSVTSSSPYYPGQIGAITGLSNSVVSNCYWLYDSATGQGMENGVGVDDGVSKDMFALTEAGLKGGDTGMLLYAQTTGVIHTHILGALNSWAYENRATQQYSGWDIIYDNHYPVLIGGPASQPTDGDGLFKLSPTSVQIGARETSFTISVSTTMDYSIDSTPDRVKAVSKVKSDSEQDTWIHTFSSEVNFDSEPKSGQIVFKTTSGMSAVVDFIQDGYSEVFTITPSEIEVTAAGGEIQFDIESTLEYSLSSTPSWIHEGETETLSNSGNTVRHHFTVDMYSGNEDRTGTIVFCNEDQQCVPATVVQKSLGSGPAIELSTVSISFISDGGEHTLNINSNTAWTLSSDQSWCTVSATGGNSGITAITVKATKNTTSSSRVARLTVKSSDGTITKTVNVAQSSKKDFNADEWKDKNFYHRSLFMRFTATWCGWCPRMNKTISLAQQKYPDKLLHLAVHDSDSDLAFDEILQLRYKYGVNSFPTGLVDGRTIINNKEIEETSELIIATAKETEQNYGTATGLTMSSSLNGRDLTIDIDAFVKYSGNYKIHVFLVEDNIFGNQINYEGESSGDYQHNNIARMSLTNINGDDFTITDDYSVRSFAYSVNVPEEYNLSNMRVLVYIQTEYGSRTPIRTRDFGTFYVDNCWTAKVGQSMPLESAESGTGGNEGILPGEDIDM